MRQVIRFAGVILLAGLGVGCTMVAEHLWSRMTSKRK